MTTVASPPALPSALAWLREQADAIEADLAHLVEVNSFTDNKDGGQEVGRRLAALFSLPELTAMHVPSASGRFADHSVPT